MKDFFKYVLASFTALFVFSIIGFFLTLMVIGGIAAMGEKEVQVKPNSVLNLKIQGQIVERKIDNPIEDLIYSEQDQIRMMGLNEIRSSIYKAKFDPNIKGIYLNPGLFSCGISTVDEIKDYIEDFKTTGKFVIAYSGNYSQLGYYLAASADKVYMNPQGMLELRGLSANYTFFKKAMDKLGIEANIFKVGKYKSAIEPFINDQMSKYSKEQSEVLVNSLWGTLKDRLAKDRNITDKVLDDFAQEGMMLSNQEMTVSSGLIDDLKYTDQIVAELNDSCGRKETAEPNFISLQKYTKANVKTDKEYSRNKIAFIYAAGGIDDGSNDGIKSGELAASIRKARTDSTVKAIVLRVNSPGGSAYGSEQIWRELELAKEGKPLIVSMGDVAASGGYYISCNAHTILARPSTITGSIGIFGMIPNFKGLTDKIGVTFDGVKTNEYADLMSVVRPMTQSEKNMLQAWVERGYNTFLTRCANGRNKTIEEINEIGQGRVWSGEDAKNIDLIDKFGGVNDAINLAAEMAGLESYRLVELPEQKDFFQQLIEDLSTEVKTSMLEMRMGENYEIYKKLIHYKGLSGLQARMPYELNIQ
ncbi:signal peptide peptidase SppA [Saccharicrinis sp. FJH62]|uniref:signal peptide peptidase SppA n=1 Tax=Saccharicrinis sp. FJH62 TaxID=3344657 RepID=UPI0035D4D383